MAQDWETPAPPTQNTWWQDPNQALPVPPVPQTPAAYMLRPLSLGELLDRTFTVYKSRFWLFAGIGSLAAGLQAVISGVQLIPMHMASAIQTAEGVKQPLSPNFLAGLGAGMLATFFVLFLLYLMVFVVTQAATVYALSTVYLGNTTTIGESVRATIGKWYRYIGIGIWQAFSFGWIPGLVAIGGGILALTVPAARLPALALVVVGVLGGVPVGFILWLRNALAVQATVIEGTPVRASMRRSKSLTPGAKGRIFVLLLLAGALTYAANLLQMPLLLFVTFTLAKGGRAIGSEIAMLLVSFVGHAAVEPVAMIGLSLIYFDQRVRKEAFDLYMLLGPEPAAAAVDAAPVAVLDTWGGDAPAAPPAGAPAPLAEPAHPRTDDETLL